MKKGNRMKKHERIMIVVFAIVLALGFYGIYAQNKSPQANPRLEKLNEMTDEAVVIKEDNTLVSRIPKGNAVSFLNKLADAKSVGKPEKKERCIYEIKLLKDSKENGTIHVYPTYTDAAGETVETTYDFLNMLHGEWKTWTDVSHKEIHNYDR